MKRTSSIAFCILVLCSLLLLVNVGTTMASEPGYSITEWYISDNAVTIDGNWTNANEWRDATTQTISPTAKFEYKIDATGGGLLMTWLVEFSDKTNDAGDRWQICIDGNADGGAAPNANDNKWEIEGHTTLKQYVGTGTGWATQATTGITWKDKLTTSPHDPATHYILEFQIDKNAYAGGWGANPPPEGIRVAMYDASNAAAGWQAWPPESISKDNPARWGLIADFVMGAAPEGLTIGVMLALSSVAVVVSIRYFRKRPKL